MSFRPIRVHFFRVELLIRLNLTTCYEIKAIQLFNILDVNPDLNVLEDELKSAQEEKMKAKKKRKLEAAATASEDNRFVSNIDEISLISRLMFENIETCMKQRDGI